MRPVERSRTCWRRPALAAVAAALLAGSAVHAATCAKPLYLTFDTGHMGIAALVADVLNRQSVQVTFFAANESTQTGDGSLGDDWAPWWRERALEGHAFASHTYDHLYWTADVAPARDGTPRFRVRASTGPLVGQSRLVTAPQYCEEIGRAARRLEAITGQPPLPLYRAPGGRTSPQLIAAARSCGYAHVGWSPAGFLGDELSSEQYPNQLLLDRALRDIRAGQILVAHLGIWSRKDPWAPAVLEPLIVGLKAKGFCFATLREHPEYGKWIASRQDRPWAR
jgi:peptidoglycan/xylan/chitin deacetylase (PgdA/CDA1 family)